MIKDKVEVRNSKIHGNGVFATDNFNIGDTVVVNQVITFNNDKLSNDLIIYCYKWEDNKVCIFIGEGVWINSSTNPNVKVVLDFESKMARFVAIKNIMIGDELFYNYEF